MVPGTAHVDYLFRSVLHRNNRIYVVVEALNHMRQVNSVGRLDTQDFITSFEVQEQIACPQTETGCTRLAGPDQRLLPVGKGARKNSPQSSLDSTHRWHLTYINRDIQQRHILLAFHL